MQKDEATQEEEIFVSETKHAVPVPGSPLGESSLDILAAAESHGNEYIRKNNRAIFQKYGIDIEKDFIYEYKLETYLDWISFGDAIIKIISTFKPAEELRDFLPVSYTHLMMPLYFPADCDNIHLHLPTCLRHFLFSLMRAVRYISVSALHVHITLSLIHIFWCGTPS